MMGKKPRDHADNSGSCLGTMPQSECADRLARAANPHGPVFVQVAAGCSRRRRKSAPVPRTVDTPLALDEAESSRLGGMVF